ncbi:MAG: hypothetical protein CVT68_05265 [Actinobacteria bacterium HGW-Actinobacteria-8]|nr:MAG: hypothetical protein CVT68_05265 [Actinobacteria bacterium HGW-Actinobacteria-8]
MAAWVRFADTKATILTAGLAAVATMLVGKSSSIFAAVSAGCVQGYVVGGLGVVAIGALFYTLFQLAMAIGPRTSATSPGLNRFAWPTLLDVTAENLSEHAATVDPRRDAWRQVIDLAAIADRKFRACNRAVWGFVGFVVAAVTCIGTAAALTV